MMFAIALALSSALVSGTPPSAALEALDAVTEDGALIYVARDGRTVCAMDLASGAERWQVELQGVDKVQAAVLHKLAPHRLLLQVPGRYFALDVTHGLLSSRSGPPDWTFVWRGGGACALRSPCVLQPISCDDGRALGPALHERDGREMFGEHDSARPICISNPGVLGTAKGLSLYLESHLRDAEDAAVVLAVDSTGKQAWRSSSPACRSCAQLGFGAATDGSLCWTTQLGEGKAILNGFDCATGQALFTRELPQEPAMMRQVVTGWTPEPTGLLFVGSGRAQLIAKDGKDRWVRAMAPGVLPLPRGLKLPSSYPLALDWVTSVERVDAATGKKISTEALGRNELRIAADGSPLILPAGGTSDRGGAFVAAPRLFRFTRDPAGSRVELGGKLKLKTSGDAWVLGEHWTAQEVILVVAASRKGGPDQIYIIRAPRPG